MRDWARIIKTACIFAGMIFGAGFASGQEHMVFFIRHGIWGIFGVVLAGIVMALCGWAVLDICVRNKIADYRSFMAHVFGKWLGAVLDVVTALFIFVLFSAMLAGAGALGVSLGLPFTAGVLILAAAAFVVLLFDFKGIVEVNLFITPILVIGAVGLGLLAIFTNTQTVGAAFDSPNIQSAVLSSGIYSSYNMLTAIAVLSAMPTVVNSRKVAKYGGLLGGFLLILVGLVLVFALFVNLDTVNQAELPMLVLAQNFSSTTSIAYTIILFLAIFTTAATNGFALISWTTSRFKIKSIKTKLALIVAGIAVAHFGFSAMVSNAYTFFGFLGLFIVVAIIAKFVLGRGTS